MTSIGVPLPHIPVTPPQPNPRSDQPAAPDADQFRDGLYDARRELMRARAAALPMNVILGGFAPTLFSGALQLGPGVAQVRIPTATWTTSYPPATGKLYGPAEAPSGLLSEASHDGAYRAERRTAALVIAGNGTTGPATGDSIVYLKFNSSAPDRLATAWDGVSGFSLDDFSVPVAWVRVAAGQIIAVRDLRPMPPWRPRFAQRVYASPLPLAKNTATLIPVDLGSFWLEAGQAILFTMGVRVSTPLSQHAHETVRVQFHLGRGDASDGFAAPHLWDSPVVPASVTSCMNVGRNWFGTTQLFLPPNTTDPGAFTPGVFHFNGLVVTDISTAWKKNDETGSGRNGTFLYAQCAYLKAELVTVRKSDDLFANLVQPDWGARGQFPSWGAQAFPPVAPVSV